MTAHRFLWLATGSYALLLIVVAVIVERLSDSSWWPTLILFAPRWIWAVPAVVLAPTAILLRHWRALAALMVCGAFFMLTIMGFELPSPVTALAREDGEPIRVMTANLGGGGGVARASLAATLHSARVDVAAFQECRDEVEPLRRDGWRTHSQYGLCVASRYPILDVEVRDPRDMWKRHGSGLMIRYELQTPKARLTMVNVHLETVRPAISGAARGHWREPPHFQAIIEQRRLESQVARAFVDASAGPVIVVGDFNLPVESAIYREYWSTLTNAFSKCGLGTGHTKLTRWHGIRIDHVLLGQGLSCTSAAVMRGSGVGFDHRPLIADVIVAAR